MLLYNVTITIDQDVQQDWLHWMRHTHIPDVMATGMFLSCRICRLLSHEHAGSEIYTVQYLVQDMDHLQRYMDEHAPGLQRQHQQRYDGRYAAFRTVMELVDEG